MTTMKFRNPETGEVFPFAFLAWRSFCKGRKCEGCSIRTPMQEGGYAPHCDYFICEHPHEAARLMGFEVVEDETEDSMFYSQSLDVLNPAKAIREALEKEANVDKPKICEVLGVEVGEPFSIDGYPTDYGMVQVCEDGKIRRVISSAEFPFAQDGEVGHKIGSNALYYLLNHPDRIIRKPRFTQQEVESAKIISVLFPEATHIERLRGSKVLGITGAEDGWIADIESSLFPEIKSGQSVTLDQIIGGAE